METKLSLSKLDVAKRQLETAIRLYFNNSDPVSIHTLTCAAYNILRDLNRTRGGGNLQVKDGVIDLVKKDSKKEVRLLISKAENYFKHANRDHSETLEFNPRQSDFLLLEGCSTYEKLTGERPPLMQLCQIWLMSNYPNIFNLPIDQKKALSISAPEMVQLGRQQYFNFALPIIMKMNF